MVFCVILMMSGSAKGKGKYCKRFVKTVTVVQFFELLINHMTDDLNIVLLYRCWVEFGQINECLRPYLVEYTSSRPITEVKQPRARLVLGWVTAASFYFLSFFNFGNSLDVITEVSILAQSENTIREYH